MDKVIHNFGSEDVCVDCAKRLVDTSVSLFSSTTFHDLLIQLVRDFSHARPNGDARTYLVYESMRRALMEICAASEKLLSTTELIFARSVLDDVFRSLALEGRSVHTKTGQTTPWTPVESGEQ